MTENQLEKILIVEDEEAIRNQLRWGLSEDYEVLSAATADEARHLLRTERPSVVALDVTLNTPGRPAEEGLELLEEIVDRFPQTKVVMVTGNTSRENALLALQRGAVDWYGKPIDLGELKLILKRALHIRAIEQAEQRILSRRRYHEQVGESGPMQKVFSMIQRVAPTDATVLIIGENGTGKELIAHAVHQAGPRRDKPFVPIHCGAIPETLIESELFGHERGAFTDAHRAREGKFELAEGGTVFLDEIGELPPPVQVKLLRFLQDHRVERVGGRETREVDVRVVAATNRDLGAAIIDGTFRQDLYYRLGVVTITAPPLRSRGDDVRILAEYFLEYYARHHKRKIRGFTQSALRALAVHPWPGNVRELENRVQRAIILAQDAFLRPEDLELEEARTEEPGTLQSARDRAERETVIQALVRNAGNITRAARDVDVSRPTFHDLLKRHGIEASRYRRSGSGEAGEEVEDEA
jgi:two-component system, NtrC family, response regulator